MSSLVVCCELWGMGAKRAAGARAMRCRKPVSVWERDQPSTIPIP